MEKDEIKKALECCKNQCCSYCPRWCKQGCQTRTLSDAFDLITGQEKEIEQLKAENEQLKEKVKNLKADFDSLQEDYEFVRDCDAEHCLEIDETVKQAKIDVLNELKEQCWDVGVLALTDHDIDKMIEELKK